jgi:hypothetical protein
MYNFDDKINFLESLIKAHKRNREDFRISSNTLNREISILEEILEDEKNLKFKDSGHDW